jgi:hypothetical protein
MNRWYFWVLAPVLVADGIRTAFSCPATLVARLRGSLCLLRHACFLPRSAWRGRFASGGRSSAWQFVVLLAYLAYVGSEAVAWWHGKPFGFGLDRARANLFNAIRGLLVFGLPAMHLLIRGRSGTSADVVLCTDTGEVRASEKGAVEQ